MTRDGFESTVDEVVDRGRAENGVPAEPASEEVRLCFGNVEVAILRVADLREYVDPEVLLGIEEPPDPPYWMHLWPGALVLARRLAEIDLAGRRVLEVGCGLGLPALLAARLGAAVVATDWQVGPLRMLRQSAARNASRVATVQMDWHHMAVRRHAFDLVVGADVAYDVAEEHALAVAFAESVRPGGRLILADSVNTYRRGFVGRLQSLGFQMKESEVAEDEEGRVVWVRLLEGERR